MRVFSAIASVLALCGLLAACDTGTSEKIGVVDMNRLMRESVPGKAGLKYIEAQQAELQAKLDAVQDRLEKNPGDEGAAQELQKLYAESQQRIQSEGQNVVTKLLDAIQKSLDVWRAQHGYAMLIRLEALDSFDAALDVTNAIMSDIDKLKLDFNPPSDEKIAKDGAPAGETPEATPEKK